ncbi:UNVERIFIED_CONTAM: hypothetical protein HDU68_001517 [Siphonaria sp. JEL0065]|nr:hypothetical protein HDU68_001517 [Siphonaria sp. JEL0065]
MFSLNAKGETVDAALFRFLGEERLSGLSGLSGGLRLYVVCENSTRQNQALSQSLASRAVVRSVQARLKDSDFASVSETTGINALLLRQWFLNDGCLPMCPSTDPPSAVPASSLCTSPDYVLGFSRAIVHASGVVSVLVAVKSEFDENPFSDSIFENDWDNPNEDEGQQQDEYVRMFLGNLTKDVMDKWFDGILHVLTPPGTSFMPLDLAYACIKDILCIYLHEHDLVQRLNRLLFQLESVLAEEAFASSRELKDQCLALTNLCTWINLPLFGGIKMLTLTIMLHELTYLLSLPQMIGINRHGLKIIFQQHCGIQFSTQKYLEVAFDCLADGLELLANDITSTNETSTKQPATNTSINNDVLSTLSLHSLASTPIIPPPPTTTSTPTLNHANLLKSQLQRQPTSLIYPTPQESPLIHAAAPTRQPFQTIKQHVLNSVCESGILPTCTLYNLSVLQIRSWCFDPIEIAQLHTATSGNGTSKLIQIPNKCPIDPPTTIYSLYCTYNVSIEPRSLTAFQIESNGAMSALLSFYPLDPFSNLQPSFIRTYIATMTPDHFQNDFKALGRRLIAGLKNPSVIPNILHATAFDVITLVYRYKSRSEGSRGSRGNGGRDGMSVRQEYLSILESLADGVEEVYYARMGVGKDFATMVDRKAVVGNLMEFVDQSLGLR